MDQTASVAKRLDPAPSAPGVTDSAPGLTDSAPGVTIGGRRLRQSVLDVGFAVIVATVGFLETTRTVSLGPGSSALDLALELLPVGLIVAGGLSLSLRRHFPLTVMVITAAALQSREIDETGSGWIATLVAAFSAGMQHTKPRDVALAFAAITVVVLGVWAVSLAAGTADPIQPIMIGLVAAIFWVGTVMRTRTREAAELQSRAVRLELERRHDAERAAAAERTRIARELHDVIAHSLSVVVIQAAAAKRLLDTDPQRARESLDAVEQTGRSAMLEMRRLLGVVRRDEQDAQPHTDVQELPPRIPQPSVAELGRLVADMRQAGLDVTLRVEGESREVPVGVDVSAYRIVQEALTNVGRHSPGATAEVLVRYRPHVLEVVVEDDGGGRQRARQPTDPELSADRERSSGHGLVGMRERVTLLRGELEVGPRPGTGFAVHARLPLDEDQA